MVILFSSLPFIGWLISVSAYRLGQQTWYYSVAISCKHLLTKCHSGCTKARHFKWKIQKIFRGGAQTPYLSPVGGGHPSPHPTPSTPSASNPKHFRNLVPFPAHTLLDTFRRLCYCLTVKECCAAKICDKFSVLTKFLGMQLNLLQIKKNSPTTKKLK